jgi:hypothetical protein
MSFFDDPPLHDFPDRAIRRIQASPENLRDLIADLLPDLVDRFDFDRLEDAGREFVLEDWRRRENDLLFRLPFRNVSGDTVNWALVCLLIEHQSEPDPVMPLRVLLYAVLFWESEWRQWEAGHPTGEPLRLTPVIPIVFHTGAREWRAHREMIDLLGGPAEVERFAPRWPILFWDLAARSTEELLHATGEWMASLAVVRAEREVAAEYRAVFAAVMRRLEPLRDQDPMRWHDLMWFILSWTVRRRPGEEREALLEAARSSQMDLQHREEVEELSTTVVETWEQELVARGEARGEARGRAEGLIEGEINTRREDLRLLLEERFGPLPEALAARIAAINDAEQLRDALRQVVRLRSLEDLAF